MIHTWLSPGSRSHLLWTVCAVFDQEGGNISLFLQKYFKLDGDKSIWSLLFYLEKYLLRCERKIFDTCVVIGFEQFLFEFFFVLETSQTVHGLEVLK